MSKDDTIRSEMTQEPHRLILPGVSRDQRHAPVTRPEPSDASRSSLGESALQPPLWHPRHWPMHVGLALLRLTVIVLPFGALLFLGTWLGRLGYVVARRRRHIAEVNLKLCFPDLPADVRDQRVRRHFEALGTELFEMGLCWWGNRDRLAPLLHLEGIEHLERAHAEGRGVLMLSCHTTYHELACSLVAPHAPVLPMAIYRPFKSPVLDRAATRGRARHARLVHRRNPRAALRYLKEGGLVWYAPDQSEGRGRVLVPFFAEPKVMNTGAARMARASGALVMPIQQVRLPGTTGYRIIVRPPLEGFPTGDDVIDATRLIRLVEEQVELAPDHYSWVHSRFRKRLGMLPNPYDH